MWFVMKKISGARGPIARVPGQRFFLSEHLSSMCYVSGPRSSADCRSTSLPSLAYRAPPTADYSHMKKSRGEYIAVGGLLMGSFFSVAQGHSRECPTHATVEMHHVRVLRLLTSSGFPYYFNSSNSTSPTNSDFDACCDRGIPFFGYFVF